jgi:hypothetical protein
MIVTVVATGFDESYFAKTAAETKSKSSSDNISKLGAIDPQTDYKSIDNIDMDLDDSSQDEHDFTKDQDIPNIWSIDEENDGDKNSEDVNENTGNESSSDKVVTTSLEEDLEKPSFLRRLAKRRNKDDSSDADSDK